MMLYSNGSGRVLGSRITTAHTKLTRKKSMVGGYRHVTTTSNRLRMHVGRALLLVTNTAHSKKLVRIKRSGRDLTTPTSSARYETKFRMNMHIPSHINHSYSTRLGEKNDRLHSLSPHTATFGTWPAVGLCHADSFPISAPVLQQRQTRSRITENVLLLFDARSSSSTRCS